MFFALAPGDRVHNVTSWFKAMTGDPIARCVRHYKNDFLSPDSLRFVRLYGNDKVTNSEFAIEVSATTQGGGRGISVLDCPGKGCSFSDYKPSPLRKVNRELGEEIRRLKELNKVKERELNRDRELKSGSFFN